VISGFSCVAIRIDKEHPLEDLVGRIKEEIRNALYIVADLTDERPSCYFEAGFAEALGRPVCGEFQFRREPESERGRCSVGASDTNRGVRSKAKVHRCPYQKLRKR
jgi:hypothetical protein